MSKTDDLRKPVQDMIEGKIKVWKNTHMTYEAKSKIKKLEKRILDLETKLYYCLRNKKLTNCNHCNRSDGTCGCANQ